MSEQAAASTPVSAPADSSGRRDFARSMDSLEEVFAFAQALLDARRVGTGDCYAVMMAIEELFTNMVKYNPDGAGPIGVEIRCDSRAVACRLTDPDCAPFDITRIPDVDIDQAVERRRPGGLGIHLMRRMVDAVDYEHAGRRSRISFRRDLVSDASGRGDSIAAMAGTSRGHGLISPPVADAGDRAMFEIGYGNDGMIALTGRFDAAQCDKAQQFLDAAPAAGVFDFRGLEYISSAGLGVLLKAHKRLLASGARLRLVNVNSHIYDIFRFSGFDRVFDVERAGS